MAQHIQEICIETGKALAFFGQHRSRMLGVPLGFVERASREGYGGLGGSRVA